METVTKAKPGRRPRSEAVDDAFLDARTALAKRVMGHLLRRGWSQSELARRSGLGRDVVNKYVNGRAFPTPSSAKSMADALSISPLDLLYGSAGAEVGTVDQPQTDLPPVAFRALGDGQAYLQINMEVPFELAIEILAMLPRTGSASTVSAA